MLSSLNVDKEASRLAALRRYELLDTEREPAFNDIAELARLICKAPMATVTLVDHDRQWFKARVGLELDGSSRSDSLCTFAIEDNEPLVIEDTLLDGRSCDNAFVTKAPQLRFYAGAPLTTPSGHNVGTVCVFDVVPRRLEPEQIAALKALARQTVAQMELRVQVRERELHSKAMRTAEKLAVVGRMASSIAHEINNPLQSVTNLLFVAETQAEEQNKEILQQAQDELRRVTQIVTQTLRFHSQSAKPEQSRLGVLVESVVTLFNTRLRHAGATLLVEDQQTDLLTCFASDVRQVFANFLGNALDAVSATEPRAIRVRIRNTSHPRSHVRGVRITFMDSGVGIPAENQPKLAEPFFSTKGARGTGLGLWVSRGILDKHLATLTLRSAITGTRRGTTFSIFFPLENALLS